MQMMNVKVITMVIGLKEKDMEKEELFIVQEIHMKEIGKMIKNKGIF